jgi:dTDP-4-amino-4,6-dideoxygalactose transaminase
MGAKLNYAVPGMGIGGDFPLPVELLGARVKLDPRAYFGLQQGRFLLYDSGRSAMRSLLSHLASSGVGQILLPSYLCPAVLQPVKEVGLSYKFYRVDSELQIDVGNLSDCLRERPAAVILIHYFGFPASEAIWRLFASLTPPPIVVEDCAQALLTKVDDAWLGRRGDYGMTSLRKWLPVPDGAWLLAKDRLPQPPLAGSLSEFSLGRTLGMFLKGMYLESRSPNRTHYRMYRTILEEAEHELEKRQATFGASEVTAQLLAKLDYEDIVARRRDNFAHVLRRTERLASIRPLFDCLPEGVCPLGFPVLAESRKVRDSLRQYLVDHGVYPPIHWVLPDDVEASVFGDSRCLAERILTIPTDQRYGRPEMDRIGQLLSDFEGAHVTRSAPA